MMNEELQVSIDASITQSQVWLWIVVAVWAVAFVTVAAGTGYLMRWLIKERRKYSHDPRR